MNDPKPFTITVAPPNDFAELERSTVEDAPGFAAIKVTNEDSYAFADALLSEVVRRKDAAVKMRRSATGPLKDVIKTIEGWFRPVVQTLEASELHLKGELGAYRLAQAAAEREAREAAAKAAATGDGAALVQAAQDAADAAQAPTGRASVGFTWAAIIEDPDAVPRSWCAPDVKAINAHARAAKASEPAPIPGVRFERAARVGARR